MNDGDVALDMGGAILFRKGGYKISQRAGYLGFAWNFPMPEAWFIIGYPNEAPFGGQKQIICASSFAYVDASYAPPTVGAGCDQTGGATGGPWIKGFSGGAGFTNYLNGNTSYRYVGNPLELYSPYFDDAAKAFRDTLVADHP